jgi:2-iminobutanoate/2-iminopropanoate deaminase
VKKTIMRPDVVQTLPYSHAVMASGRLLYISGQGPVTSEGTLVTGDLETQTRLTLDNLAAVAAAAGTDLSRAVKVNVFLLDVQRDFAAFNAVYRTVFTENPPARTTVQAVLPLPGMLVEIEAVLALDED